MCECEYAICVELMYDIHSTSNQLTLLYMYILYYTVEYLQTLRMSILLNMNTCGFQYYR